MTTPTITKHDHPDTQPCGHHHIRPHQPVVTRPATSATTASGPPSHPEPHPDRRPSGPSIDIEGLFEEHWPRAVRIARSYVGDRAQAEDVAAEAVLKVIEAVRAGGGPVENPAGYLCVTVRNLALRHLGRDRVHLSIDEGAEPAQRDPPDDDFGELRDAFASLPERWQLVLWSTEVEGRSARDLARHWDTSANAVAALSYRARAALRNAVAERLAHARPCHPCPSSEPRRDPPSGGPVDPLVRLT